MNEFGKSVQRELDLSDHSEDVEPVKPPVLKPAKLFQIPNNDYVVTSVETIIEDFDLVKYKVEMILNGTVMPTIGDIIDVGFGKPVKARISEMTVRRDDEVMPFFDGPNKFFVSGLVERRLDLLCDAVP